MTVIVFRYLFRETLKTQLAVLFVLLLIFVSQQFIQIIGDAAEAGEPGTVHGDLPGARGRTVASGPERECYLNASCAQRCCLSSMNRDDIQFLRRIGDRIRERRTALELTQAELADKCGLHRTFIGSVERGERNVAVLSLRKIAVALRVTPAELLTERV